MDVLEPNLLHAMIAGLPIAAVLVLMVFLRRSAAVAGAMGLGISVVTTLTVFRPEPEELGLTRMLGGAALEGSFTAATILWIIFGALCLYHLQDRTGALGRLRDAVASISGNRQIIAILIGWFFALFAEGAAGFGTAIALAAPFLVGFGFAPAQALVITLIGHSVGVSFGAVGTPILTQSQLVPHSALELGVAAAGFHVGLGWVMLVALLRFVKPAEEDEAVRGSIWWWAALASAAYLAPMYVIARFVGPELPTMAGALVGATIFIAVFLLVHRGRERERTPLSGLASAAAPYLVVIGLILLTRLVVPVREALSDIAWTWTLWDQFRGDFKPLLHPGTLLMAGFFLGGALGGASASDFRGAIGDALRKLVPVTLALLAMLGLSRVMVHAGMIDALAVWTASVSGRIWPFISPWVGVLGAFVTGSATASNILFSEFQLSTTTRLGMSATTLLGAQSFGAAVGNIICPHNIIAGGATVGVTGEEGAILRQTLGACVLYATLGGLLAMFLAG